MRTARQRQCVVCECWYPDPGPGRRKHPAGVCSELCARERQRRRAQGRAASRRVPPRALFTSSSRDWTQARAKVDAEARCRFCGTSQSIARLEAAHIIPRSLAPNGGEDPLNIVPLCATSSRCHQAYDQGRIDLLPVLTLEEQECAVRLAGGLAAALRVTTGKRDVVAA
jgi:hypothetical protein